MMPQAHFVSVAILVFGVFGGLFAPNVVMCSRYMRGVFNQDMVDEDVGSKRSVSEAMSSAVSDVLHEDLAVGGSSDVDVFIGTAGHGHVFPGATVPFGMVQATPFLARTGQQNWDGLSGYHRDATSKSSQLVGFGHTALSGTGIGDGGDVLLLPWASQFSNVDQGPGDLGVGLDIGGFGPTAVLLHNAGEQGVPGYYRAELQMSASGASEKPSIVAEMSAGMRHAVHRYTWGDGLQKPRLLVNLRSTVDHTQETDLRQLPQKEPRIMSRISKKSMFCGYRESTGALNHKVAFHMEMDTANSTLEKLGAHVWAINLPESTKELTVRVGLSHNDEQHASSNLASSMVQSASETFDGTKKAAAQRWQDVLGRVKVTAPAALRRRLYTGLYHAMMGPTRFDDADSTGQSPYSTYSLWDSYRSLHPLLNLIVPEMSDGFAQGLLQTAESNGELPLWQLWGTDTNWMLGAPAAVVLSEMVMKNLTAPTPQLYKSVTSLLEKGNSVDKSYVAEGLERAIAAKCVAQVASRMGDSKGVERMSDLANSYKEYWDPDTQMFWGGKGRSGGADPNAEDGRFVEGTGWQYSFLVPHDIPGLIKLLGSKEKLEQRLDTLFYSLPEAHMKFKIPDIENGNLGGATIGNEPDMHVPYLYNYAGVPWKTQRALDRMEDFFTARRDGIPGNDDVGALSSWFVWSALGLYPVDVCSGRLEIGRPLLHSAEILVGPKTDKKKLTIRTFRSSEWLLDGRSHPREQPIGPEDRYVQKVTWNGVPVTETSVRYEDLIKGGELKFQMGFDPNVKWPHDGDVP